MRKVAMVTGGSRGIGAAIVETLAKNGWDVAFCYEKNSEAAMTLSARLCAEGGTVLPLQADVSDAAQVAAMFDRCREELGAPMLLVNNAGFAQQKMFCDITPEEWRRMFAVHVDGAYHCTQQAIGEMVRRKAGCIINVSSMWGQVGASCEVHYSAAKAALIGLTKALAKELGPSGITVNCIAPGVIDTEMNRMLGEQTLQELCEEIPLARLGRAEDVAALCLYLAEQGGAYLTGQVLGVNGGFVI